MKKLKRKLIIESVISLTVMLAGVWGVFGPFELLFVSPMIHMVLSAIVITFGLMSFWWGLDSYIGNAKIIDLKATHAVNLQIQYRKIQSKNEETKLAYRNTIKALGNMADMQHELKEAQIQAISWKGNFKKIQGKYNELKNKSKPDKESNIKKWYVRNFPKDDMGSEIKSDVTFLDLKSNISNVYDYIGVDDSIVRERLFIELAKRMNVDYDYIYNKWLKAYYLQ